MAARPEKQKRYKKAPPEPLKINLRLIASALMIIIAAIIKIMPGSGLQSAIERISESSADYRAMFSEIIQTVKKYSLPEEGFVMPVNGEMTSPFGERTDPASGEPAFHFGIDLNAAEGTPVRAAYSGKVARCDSNGYYGNFIIIDHPKRGISTLYGHLGEIKVSPGDEVPAGSEIGLSGNTGKTSGPHLHFEIRRNNTPEDPSLFIGQ